jgi:glycerate 2-kinase
MRILICPNAFKNSLAADLVANAILDGLLQSELKASYECFPIGDGGDGTGDITVKRLKGKNVNVEVNDPLGRMISSSFGFIDKGRSAVIEMASASGLKLLKPDELDPLHALSTGTGQQIRRALELGVTRVILCVGGSATVDGGIGILQALGARFLDERGVQLSNLPANLVKLHSIDVSGMDARVYDCEFIVLCDVSNPLLGPEGAAHVFGPQKGASPDDVALLEIGMRRLCEVMRKQTGKSVEEMEHAGAAGGVAGMMNAFFDAKLVNGIDYFLQLTGFDRVFADADVVITGEGSLDEQTLHGKGPFGIAKRAANNGIPVIGFAGKVPVQRHKELSKYFNILIPIGNAPSELSMALRNTADNLKRSACEVGNLMALGQKVGLNAKGTFSSSSN